MLQLRFQYHFESSNNVTVWMTGGTLFTCLFIACYACSIWALGKTIVPRLIVLRTFLSTNFRREKSPRMKDGLMTRRKETKRKRRLGDIHLMLSYRDAINWQFYGWFHVSQTETATSAADLFCVKIWCRRKGQVLAIWPIISVIRWNWIFLGQWYSEQSILVQELTWY